MFTYTVNFIKEFVFEICATDVYSTTSINLNYTVLSFSNSAIRLNCCSFNIPLDLLKRFPAEITDGKIKMSNFIENVHTFLLVNSVV